MLMIVVKLARISAPNHHPESHPHLRRASSMMGLFSFPTNSKHSPCSSDAEPNGSQRSLPYHRAGDPQSSAHLETLQTSLHPDGRGFRIRRRHTTTDHARQALFTAVSNPGSRLTPEVITQISAAVLRQHRVFNNLSPRSRARLPLHLHRIRPIRSFEPATHTDIRSFVDDPNVDIPIILTTFYTETDDTHSRAPVDTESVAKATSNTSRTPDAEASEYSWLELDASDGEDKADATVGSRVSEERRKPGDTPWLGDLIDSSPPLLLQRAAPKSVPVKRNEMQSPLPIAAEFAPRGELGLRHGRDSCVFTRGMQIEPNTSESPKENFKVFPRSAIPLKPPQRTLQQLPMPERLGRVGDWLTGVSLGRSGETPSTSESGRTKSLETTSTVDTAPQLQQQAIQDGVREHSIWPTRPIASKANAYSNANLETTSTADSTPQARQETMQTDVPKHAIGRTRPITSKASSQPPPAASQTEPHSQPRFSTLRPRLTTIVDVSPPEDHNAPKPLQPPRYRRRR